MTAYVVRVMNSQELVGLFSASNLTSLIELVDHVCDPGACEYARLRDGGMIFEGTAPVVPLVLIRGDEDGNDPLLRPSDFAGSWWNDLYRFEDDPDKLSWRSLAADAADPYMTGVGRR